MSEESPAIGERVYTEDGRPIGTISDVEDGGIMVQPLENELPPAALRGRRVQGFGEAELMWRCGQCGEMGNLDEMPDTCPNCGAAKEELYYWTED